MSILGQNNLPSAAIYLCLLCGEKTQALVCPACSHDLDSLSAPAAAYCKLCALPLPAPAPFCATCLRRPPAFDASYSALPYAFPVDRLLHALKFSRQGYTARFGCAVFFAHRMLATAIPEGDILIPVPLSAQRLRDRGFNQALEIARPLAKHLRLPIKTDWLLRVRDTPPQSQLPWHARQGNLRNAFACTSDLSGLSLIVVDDVMTTGATLQAVAKTLKQQGAMKVSNWVACRTAH